MRDTINTTETEFTVHLAGSQFRVDIDDGRHGTARGTIRIQCVNDGFMVCENSGYCNPLTSFWSSPRALLRGAARDSASLAIIRQTVASELEQMKEFTGQMIEAEEDVGPELIKFLAGFTARAAIAAA